MVGLSYMKMMLLEALVPRIHSFNIQAPPE